MKPWVPCSSSTLQFPSVCQVHHLPHPPPVQLLLGHLSKKFRRKDFFGEIAITNQVETRTYSLLCQELLTYLLGLQNSCAGGGRRCWERCVHAHGRAAQPFPVQDGAHGPEQSRQQAGNVASISDTESDRWEEFTGERAMHTITNIHRFPD